MSCRHCWAMNLLPSHGEGGILGDHARDGFGAGHQLVGVEHLAYEPHAEGVGGLDAVAGEEDVHGVAEGDEAGEVVDGVAGEDAALHLEQAEPGLGRADADVAVEGAFEAAGDAEPVDGGDEGLRGTGEGEGGGRVEGAGGSAALATVDVALVHLLQGRRRR